MKRNHRPKELTELQVLKLENKNLRAELNTVKKQLRRLKKQEHFHEETILDEEAEQMNFDLEPPVHRCPKCNKGTLVEYNIVGRLWSECDQCDYRSRTKKI